MIGFIIGAALFWFAIVWVTQNHHLNWLDFILYYALAHFISFGLSYLLVLMLGDELRLVAQVAFIVLYAGALTAILVFRFGYESPKMIAKIIGLYFGLTLLFELIISFFIHMNHSLFINMLKVGT